MTHNILNWVDIPVTDMGRAITFYEAVFATQLNRQAMGDGLEMAFFPFDPQASGASGALCQHAQYYAPSTTGTLVYLSSQAGDLNVELSRIEAAGGTILQPKTTIAGGFGHLAIFLDSEGNKVGLHSNQ